MVPVDANPLVEPVRAPRVKPSHKRRKKRTSRNRDSDPPKGRSPKGSNPRGKESKTKDKKRRGKGPAQMPRKSKNSYKDSERFRALDVITKRIIKSLKYPESEHQTMLSADVTLARGLESLEFVPNLCVATLKKHIKEGSSPETVTLSAALAKARQLQYQLRLRHQGGTVMPQPEPNTEFMNSLRESMTGVQVELETDPGQPGGETKVNTIIVETGLGFEMADLNKSVKSQNETNVTPADKATKTRENVK
jgi:hypothetical protein